VLLPVAVRLFEDRDQVRRVRDVRLVPVGPDRLDRVQVLLACPTGVEKLFLALGRGADAGS
jgi:hypothetical protein